MRPPRLRTTGPITRWCSAISWAATSSPSSAVKRVNPSRSVNITVTGWERRSTSASDRPSDRPCSALSPTEASIDGRRSVVRSRNRCTISTGGAVRNGLLGRVLEPGPVDQPDVGRLGRPLRVAADQIGQPLGDAAAQRGEGLPRPPTFARSTWRHRRPS